MKQVKTIIEARDHFKDSIDPVLCEFNGKEVQANSLAEAEKIFAETTGESEGETGTGGAANPEQNGGSEGGGNPPPPGPEGEGNENPMQNGAGTGE